MSSRADGGWEAIGRDWAELTRTQSPLADPTWIRCFADAFAGDASIHAIADGDRIVAALPLVASGGLARAWTSLDNEHHPYWLISGALDPDAARLLLRGLLDRSDYLFLRRLPVRDPSCVALVDAARALGFPTVQLESEAGDARIELAGSWPAFRARLPKNFQRDLPRKQRQLEKRGRLELGELAEPGPALDAALAACFELETRGWKGTDGSPILRDPSTARFYGELARGLAAEGRFVLYTLSLDGQIVAFEYCLRGGGHIEMLKLSFDPAYDKQSPGQVLRMLLLERELERGEVRYYHLGRPSAWKLRWATEVAPLCTLRIYARTPRARAAHLLGPVLRARLKGSPLARRVRQLLERGRPAVMAGNPRGSGSGVDDRPVDP